MGKKKKKKKKTPLLIIIISLSLSLIPLRRVLSHATIQKKAKLFTNDQTFNLIIDNIQMLK